MTNAVLYCKKRVYSHSLSKTAGSCGLLIASIDPCPMDGGAPALVSALVRVRTIGGRPGHAIVKYGAFNAAVEDKVAIELSTTGAPSAGQREFDEKTAAALRMSLDDVQANMARQNDVRMVHADMARREDVQRLHADSEGRHLHNERALIAAQTELEKEQAAHAATIAALTAAQESRTRELAAANINFQREQETVARQMTANFNAQLAQERLAGANDRQRYVINMLNQDVRAKDAQIVRLEEEVLRLNAEIRGAKEEVLRLQPFEVRAQTLDAERGAFMGAIGAQFQQAREHVDAQFRQTREQTAAGTVEMRALIIKEAARLGAQGVGSPPEASFFGFDGDDGRTQLSTTTTTTRKRDRSSQDEEEESTTFGRTRS